MHAVFLGERDDVVKVEFLDLAFAHFHHALRYVATDKAVRMKHLGGKNGEVAGAGGNVENFARTVWRNGFYGLASPSLVNIPRQLVIQLVVGGGYAVEHPFHLLSLVAIVVVWLDFFLFVHNIACKITINFSNIRIIFEKNYNNPFVLGNS